jgi:hypothetical protein
VRHTHAARAAFSGGLAHSYFTGATARRAIHTAFMVATAHCTTTGQIPRQCADPDLTKDNQP